MRQGRLSYRCRPQGSQTKTDETVSRTKNISWSVNAIINRRGYSAEIDKTTLKGE